MSECSDSGGFGPTPHPAGESNEYFFNDRNSDITIGGFTCKSMEQKSAEKIEPLPTSNKKSQNDHSEKYILMCDDNGMESIGIFNNEAMRENLSHDEPSPPVRGKKQVRFGQF